MKKHSKVTNNDEIKGIINYESSKTEPNKNNDAKNCHNDQLGQSKVLA